MGWVRGKKILLTEWYDDYGCFKFIWCLLVPRSVILIKFYRLMFASLINPFFRAAYNLLNYHSRRSYPMNNIPSRAFQDAVYALLDPFVTQGLRRTPSDHALQWYIQIILTRLYESEWFGYQVTTSRAPPELAGPRLSIYLTLLSSNFVFLSLAPALILQDHLCFTTRFVLHLPQGICGTCQLRHNSAQALLPADQPTKSSHVWVSWVWQ